MIGFIHSPAETEQLPTFSYELLFQFAAKTIQELNLIANYDRNMRLYSATFVDSASKPSKYRRLFAIL